jgi:hypothetical protein
MAHPTYRNANGDKLPSVTTILSRFKEAGGLIHWAWQLGMEGKDYRQVRDAAADAGTIANLMVEADIRGYRQPQIPVMPSFPVFEMNSDKEWINNLTHYIEDYKKWEEEKDKWEKATKAFEAYKEWKSQTQLVSEYTEVSLTCECHQTGGTLDTILVQNKRSMGDWKSSNAIYLEYLIQLAAYKHLWEVNRPDEPIEGGFHLLRFSKDNCDFTHHYWANLDEAWTAFEHMRELYELTKKLKKRI